MFTMAFLVVVIPTTYSVPPDHVVLYFDFNEEAEDTVTDLSKYGNDGEITGSAIWENGQFGKALKLDGSVITVNIIPPSDEMKALKPPMSVGAWFRIVSFPAQWQLIIEMPPLLGERTDGWQYSLANQNPNFCTLGHRDHIADEITLEIGKWVYLVAVVDESNVTYYMDGDLEQQIAYKGPMNVTESPAVHIGAEEGTLGKYDCDIILDELWVSNKALNQEQVKAFAEPSEILPVDPQGSLAATWGDMKRR
jgi:hypothetical protein